MIKQYVIHKGSRLPYQISYDGISWDGAEIRHLRKDTYTEDEIPLMKEICKKLNQVNPVGWKFSEAWDGVSP